ncbi:DUF2178 domain-containing protein [uncultured Anaerococcus sp.]|uniref:DUF2178 domain-containing protein n=1 Tax=uncultured Anaerococcus sp. TaxID=293428 RepID=UPI002604AAAC|nr:DUF2178 domain-containing protein [uncultured Anaerococcus sp.]
MKNIKIWYIGYLIGICGLILMFTLKLNEVMQIVFAFVIAGCISISHVKIMHQKMIEKDHNYKISVNDERNEKIRDKVNGDMAFILMLLMGIIAVVCISVKAYLPAVLLTISVGASPLIMYFINRYYEKKY